MDRKDLSHVIIEYYFCLDYSMRISQCIVGTERSLYEIRNDEYPNTCLQSKITCNEVGIFNTL